MIYALREDIERAYGADALHIADRDDDALVDPGVVEAELAQVSAEIDGYLAARYRLPLAEAPAVLVRPCVDIAYYRLSGGGAALTEEKRQRYEDAVAFLRRLASGEVRLTLPEDPEADAALDGPQPVATAGPPRIFSRDQTRGL